MAKSRIKPEWKDMSELLVHFTEEQPPLPALPADAHPRTKFFHEVVWRHRTPYNTKSTAWIRNGAQEAVNLERLSL